MLALCGGFLGCAWIFVMTLELVLLLNLACVASCGREPADGVGAQWRGTRCGEKENKRTLSVAQWCTKSFAGPLSGDRGSCMSVLIPHRGGVLD